MSYASRPTFALAAALGTYLSGLPAHGQVPAAPDPDESPEVVVEQASAMVAFLGRMADGGGSAGELDQILAGPSYQAMFRHYNRSWRPDHLPPSAFRDMILGALAGGAPPENDRASQMRPRWDAAVSDIQRLSRDVRAIEALVDRGLVEDALAQAERWLPPGQAIPVQRVHLLLDGGSFPWAHEGNVGVDLLQLPRTAHDAGIDLEALGPMLAHEFHHIGLAAAWGTAETGALTDEESLALRFLRFLAGEGAAMKFVNNAPGGRAPALSTRATPDFGEAMQADWAVYRREETALWASAQDLLLRILEGQATAQDMAAEMREYWLPGPPRVLGRNYYVGAELLGAVYHYAGWDAAARLMTDPRCLLTAFDEARSGLPAFDGFPEVDPELAARLCAMGGPLRGHPQQAPTQSTQSFDARMGEVQRRRREDPQVEDQRHTGEERHAHGQR